MDNSEKVQGFLDQIKSKFGDVKVDVAIILGTGWGTCVSEMNIELEIPYAEIEGFPQCSVKGHESKFLFGKYKGKNIGVMQGRFHMYEGYTATETTYGVQVLIGLGAKVVILTNAAGGLRDYHRVNDVIIVKDIINFTGGNALVSIKPTEERPIFVPLSKCIDKELMGFAEDNCKKCGLNYHFGVYTQVLGPTFESDAEVNMFRTIGSDCVGMSTVQEAIMARYLGVRVVCLAYITDVAGADNMQTLTHEEVLASVATNTKKCGQVLLGIVDDVKL